MNPQYDLQIIIPAYNAEKYIEKCLNSILSQKTQYTYVITVINDGSTDETSQIPKNLFPTMLNVGTKIWGSFDLSDADACKALAHTDIPLLIIHGDEDMQAPLSMAYKLYDSCNGEKQLYIVHGADHSENYRKDPGGYEKIVTKFIEERIERKGD